MFIAATASSILFRRFACLLKNNRASPLQVLRVSMRENREIITGFLPPNGGSALPCANRVSVFACWRGEGIAADAAGRFFPPA
ncbi:hypothetical protein LJC34_05710, partial [Oscillospiraceae bacterium OttesenSCG-928-G22]|nr:hypothetical protein [Oscillospiraceae bacterium OttesenSCG-928-G22]